MSNGKYPWKFIMKTMANYTDQPSKTIPTSSLLEFLMALQAEASGIDFLFNVRRTADRRFRTPSPEIPRKSYRAHEEPTTNENGCSAGDIDYQKYLGIHQNARLCTVDTSKLDSVGGGTSVGGIDYSRYLDIHQKILQKPQINFQIHHRR